MRITSDTNQQWTATPSLNKIIKNIMHAAAMYLVATTSPGYLALLHTNAKAPS